MLLLACNAKNINDQFSGLRSSNNLVLTFDQCKERFTLYHDSVFLSKSNLPFTGSIEILGPIRFTDEKGFFRERQSTTALFNLKNGAFDGKQIYTSVYSGRSLGDIESDNIFIKSEIPRNLGLVKDVDYKYKIVTQNDTYNYSISRFGRNIYYKIDLLKEIKPTEIEIYWPNGNLLIKLNYSFYNINNILCNENVFGFLKELFPQNNSNVTMFHYNGKIAYKGVLNNDGSLHAAGSFFNLNGSKSDSASFKLPTGVTGHEANFNTIFHDNFNIKMRAFESYKEFFSSENLHLSIGKAISKEGTDGSVIDTTVSTNSSDIVTNDDKIKRFSLDGLKYKTLIEIHFDSSAKVTGSVEDIDLGTSASTDKANFTGTKNGDNLNVHFDGKEPVVGDNSQWTKQPWTIKKVNGKEVLNIQFLAKNYDTNKWENTNYEFTPSN